MTKSAGKTIRQSKNFIMRSIVPGILCGTDAKKVKRSLPPKGNICPVQE